MGISLMEMRRVVGHDIGVCKVGARERKTFRVLYKGVSPTKPSDHSRSLLGTVSDSLQPVM
jgi:hypothetical protein